MSKINNDWKEILEEEFQKDYFVELKSILEKEYENYTVYPPKKDILNAFFLTPYFQFASQFLSLLTLLIFYSLH